MRTFKQIEIDLETHKRLEAARQDFDESAADIIRRLLEPRAPNPSKPASPPPPPPPPAPWTSNGVTLAHGTPLRMKYKGVEHTGVVHDGAIRAGDAVFDNLSAAADHVSGVNLNGWQYWSAQIGGKWVKLDTLRPKAK